MDIYDMNNANDWLENQNIDLNDTIKKLVSNAYAAGACEAFNTLESFEYIKDGHLNEAWDKIEYIMIS